MKIIEGLIQGSQEWHRYRSKHIGASDASTIMNLNPYDSRLRLWEEKTLGWEKASNANMKRGQELEPIALQQFQLETGLLVEPMVVESIHFPWMSASFDGITKDLSCAVEIKCGRSAFALAKKGTIPDYYIAQLQHQMYISSINEIHYYCFDGNEGILMTVKFDEFFSFEILEKELEFWNCIQDFIPPNN